MGAAGITQLCAALASNTALETLLLETNNMGDDGAALLAQTLAGGMVWVAIHVWKEVNM